MSEFQFVAFRAIDRPLNEKALKYMQQQSSRAEITRWSFENEYHYGDFRGNATEMLRRGYDLHLHYSNFGGRKLQLRFSHGLPNSKALKPYLMSDGLTWQQDKHGPGGILSIAPYYESGDLDELWDLGDLINRLIPLRAEILAGDLRPLYLARLAIGRDCNNDPEELLEGPVPAGLKKLTAAQNAMIEFYDLDEALITAAASESPPQVPTADVHAERVAWLTTQPETKKDEWLAALLADPQSAILARINADFGRQQTAAAWPTVVVDRSMSQLDAQADKIEQVAIKQAENRAARQRAKKLADMAADPEKHLRECEQLIGQCKSEAYNQAAALLADLRDATAGGDHGGLAEQQAEKYKQLYPGRQILLNALRKRGFLPKKVGKKAAQKS